AFGFGAEFLERPRHLLGAAHHLFRVDLLVGILGLLRQVLHLLQQLLALLGVHVLELLCHLLERVTGLLGPLLRFLTFAVLRQCALGLLAGLGVLAVLGHLFELFLRLITFLRIAALQVLGQLVDLLLHLGIAHAALRGRIVLLQCLLGGLARLGVAAL